MGEQAGIQGSGVSGQSINISGAIERMARAAVLDSLPRNGMFNDDQLDAMASERMPTYRRIAEVMVDALLGAQP